MSTFEAIALIMSSLSLFGGGAFIVKANAKERKARAEADARAASLISRLEKARGK